MYFLGIDLGTTSCKCVLFDETGGIAGKSAVEYKLIHKDGGFIEQDADGWWNLVIRTGSEAVASSGADAREIMAMSVSSQGLSFVPVDETGNPLHNAVSWLDSRAVLQAEKLRERFVDTYIFRKTGKRMAPCYTLPKLMWMKENLPDIFRNADQFLMGLDYINLKLTGCAMTDYSMASGTMAFDISAKQWDPELLAAGGVDPRRLPPAGCAGSLVGRLLPGPARKMGLPPGIPVMLGAQDQKCAALGAGIGKGIATVSLGTATAVSILTSRPVIDPQMRIPCFAFNEDRWVLESVVGTAGVCLKWLRDTLFERMTYDQMNEYACIAPLGAEGVFFYPHMEGATAPYWDSSARGFIHGITLSTSRNHLVRALMEGVAFQIRANLAVQEEVTGQDVREIRLFGGGADSDIWCRIIADVTGKPVRIPFTTETASFGAALLAGGESWTPEIRPSRREYEPDMGLSERYGEMYRRYLAIQDKILDHL